MRVVLAGASGFLGSRLRASLAGAGHDLVQLVRRPPRDERERQWDPHAGSLDLGVLEGADVVVNLAGAPVYNKRWTSAYKEVIIASRTRSSATLAHAIASLPDGWRPAVFVNASAIGYYGDTGENSVEEESPPGSGFFPEVCQAWEAATVPAADAGVRVVRIRSGLVLNAGGGILRPFALATRLFASGPLAGGRQWMPWISMADWVGAVRFAIDRDDVVGPVNVVGPDPVRNKEFTRALGRALHRPAPWPIPRFGMRIVFGEFANYVVASQRVMPGVLNRAGYTFQHSDVDSAIRAAFSG